MHRKRNLVGLATFVLVLSIFMSTLTACSTSSPGPSSSGTAPSASGNAQPTQPATGSSHAANQTPYKVGVIAALTGPAASTYAPIAEGLRIYFADLNAKGGIDGHPVQAQFEDSHADAGTAATKAQAFTSQGVNLLVSVDSSATYAPLVATAKRANTPIVMLGIGPPQALPPNPDPLVFTVAEFAGGAATVAAVSLSSVSKVAQGGPIKMAVVAVDIPGAVSDASKTVAMAKQFNIQAKLIKVPQSVTDLSPIASQIISEGDDWAVAIGPGIGMTTYTALDKLGYKGNYLYTAPIDMDELAKLKKDNFYVATPAGPWDPSRADHKQILDAAKTYGATVTNNTIAIGWGDGQAIGAALKQTGWPVTTDKMLKVMNNFAFSPGPTWPPTKWTATDHQGPYYWRLYRWDSSKQAVGPVLNWQRIDASGDPKSITDVGNQLPQ